MRVAQKSKWILTTCTVALLAACSTAPKKLPTEAEKVKLTEKQPLAPLSYPYYRVKAGDTLYSIAMRYDKDYKELSKLNNLDEKFTIYVDQKLVLEDESAKPEEKTASIVESEKIVAKPLPPINKPINNKPKIEPKKPVLSTNNEPKTEIKKTSEPVVKNTPSVGTNVQALAKSGSLTWGWPVNNTNSGQLLKRFSTEGVGSKGIDISGKRGDSVKASADGVVVYAGEGLVGYGKLIIVRHSDEYITAYAHNDRLIASEGQKVKLGQQIAELGSTGTDREKLHFEIRYKGKPVDPLSILPN